MTPRETVPQVPVPRRMRHLDRDPRGYPIPWGVWRDQDGRPHFTVNDEAKRISALVEDLCGLCGGRHVKRRWFVGGPQSAFHPQGAYYDPPLHGECLRYALKVCPYLAAPHYGKRIDTKTVREVERHRVFIDPTQIPERPEVFVAVMAEGQTLIRPIFYVRPNRPYVAVDYWRHGERLTTAEGEAFLDQNRHSVP
jgi:hypothetical protein